MLSGFPDLYLEVVLINFEFFLLGISNFHYAKYEKITN